MKISSARLMRVFLLSIFLAGGLTAAHADERKLLYVAEPGIRDYLQHGGHGVIVFDIDHGHQFVRRIPTGGVDDKGTPLAVKGISASAITKRLYISTIRTLMCLDLVTDKLLWEKSYEGGCDRMALSPDGKTIYLPSLENDHWHVIDALSGDVIKKITPKSGAHNTVYGIDGAHAYLAGLKAPYLTVTDGRTHEVTGTVGPFGAFIRPFTVNGKQTLCFMNVNELLGFEVGDLKSGKVLCRVAVEGFKPGTPKRHGCPSHGIGLTPDETELWVADAVNKRLHIFDARLMPPKQVTSIELRDEPGWITFSLDGKYAYPSTGDVIEISTRKGAGLTQPALKTDGRFGSPGSGDVLFETVTRKIVAGLKDEAGREVQSEKLLEIDFDGKEPVRAGNQFGLGQVR